MGSPFAPILAGIFMVELERKLIPIFKDHLSCWRRYPFVSSKMDGLNMCCQDFHSSIKFTYKTESGNKLSFLYVYLIRSGDNIEAREFRKPRNTDVYVYWNSFAPFQWRYSTL